MTGQCVEGLSQVCIVGELPWISIQKTMTCTGEETGLLLQDRNMKRGGVCGKMKDGQVWDVREILIGCMSKQPGFEVIEKMPKNLNQKHCQFLYTE